MKKIFLILAMFLSIGRVAVAQDCDIHLMAIVDDADQKTPAAANEYLFNRLCTIVTGNGVSVAGNYAQFFIASRASVLYEQVLGTAPTKTAVTLSLNLYIGDFFGEKVFARTSFEIRGVGESSERAYINAYRSIKDNDQIKRFVDQGKFHIMNYYNAEYKNIIKEATRLAQMRDYERALFMLSSVPVCSKGYDETTAVLMDVYQEYIDYNCQTLLMKARTEWATSPDADGAVAAAEYLNQIDPNSACYDDVMALYDEIKAKVRDDWNFEVRQKYEDQIELRRKFIDAARQVGVAYGSGQQPTTTNLMWMK